MIIIDIHAKETPTLAECVSQELQQRHGVECLRVDASAVSSFTSLRIAAVLKEHDADAIVCHRRKDLVGAADAGKLTGRGGRRPLIIYVPATEDDLTEKLTKSLLSSIDALVVPTEADKERVAVPYEKIFVIEPSAWAAEQNSKDSEDTEKELGKEPAKAPKKLRISWLGAINEAERLDALVNAVHTTAPQAYAVHVYGTGSARFVMPVVRGARYMDGLDITWHGKEYTDTEAIASTDVAIATSHIPTREHLQLLAAGVAVLDSTAPDFAEKLTAIAADPALLTQMSADALADYNARFTPAVAAEKWTALLNTLRSESHNQSNI